MQRDMVSLVRDILQMIVMVATLVVAFLALWTYHRSVKLQRAKWMKELYEKFYERDDLKQVREMLDSGNPDAISQLVKAEDAKFTDYLNFFEFLAYLSESNQIKEEEMFGLFDYYLRSLGQNPEVADYISDTQKGFEKLNKLMKKMAVS